MLEQAVNEKEVKRIARLIHEAFQDHWNEIPDLMKPACWAKRATTRFHKLSQDNKAVYLAVARAVVADRESVVSEQS